MNIRRRQILLGGVALGVVATVGSEYAARRAAQVHSAEWLALNANDPSQLLRQTFEADARKINAGIDIQASVGPLHHTIPYSREMSNLLIQSGQPHEKDAIVWGKVTP